MAEYEKLNSAGRLLICDEMYPVEDLATVISLLNQRGGEYRGGCNRGLYPEDISWTGSEPEIPGYQAYLQQAGREGCQAEDTYHSGSSAGGRGTDGSKPKLENLRESGDIEQDANLVLSLYTKAVEDMDSSKAEVPMEVSILKNRAGASDRKVDMVFNRPALKITEKAGIF